VNFSKGACGWVVSYWTETSSKWYSN